MDTSWKPLRWNCHRLCSAVAEAELLLCSQPWLFAHSTRPHLDSGGGEENLSHSRESQERSDSLLDPRDWNYGRQMNILWLTSFANRAQYCLDEANCRLVPSLLSYFLVLHVCTHLLSHIYPDSSLGPGLYLFCVFRAPSTVVSRSITGATKHYSNMNNKWWSSWRGPSLRGKCRPPLRLTFICLHAKFFLHMPHHRVTTRPNCPCNFFLLDQLLLAGEVCPTEDITSLTWSL